MAVENAPTPGGRRGCILILGLIAGPEEIEVASNGPVPG